MNKFTVLFITLICIYSCKDSGTDPYHQSNNLDSAITFTDSLGFVLGGDLTDWCYDCPRDTLDTLFIPDCTSIKPSYPNPVDNIFKIDFMIAVHGNAKVYYMNNADTLFLFNEIVNPGAYSLTCSANTLNLHNRYKKIFFKTTDKFCSGDIKFN